MRRRDMIGGLAPMRSAAVLVIGLGLCLTAHPGARAQGQPQILPMPPQTSPQRPVFRTGIDVVSVDVAVSDSKGNPVADLKPEDFEVKENNKVQKVDAFKFIKLDDGIDIDPARFPEIHSIDDQTREASRDDVRLFVIFLDDYHVRRGNDVRIRMQVAKFVNKLSPRDLVAVMHPLTPVSALTLTHNHSGTAAAIQTFTGRKYDYSPKNPMEDVYMRLTPQQIEDLRNQVTFSALESLCVMLGSLRDGRKSILYVSEGFTGTLPDAIQRQGMGLPQNPVGSNAQTDAARDRGAFLNSLDVTRMMRQVFEAASRSHTSIYTLDPRGLASSEFDVSTPNIDSATDRRTFNEMTDSLYALANNTDGRAIMNANDPGPHLLQMVRDASAYYLLGYTSTEAKHDGKFHEIKVNVKRKGITVRARKGYWAYSEDDIVRATAATGPSLPKDVEAALTTLADPPRSNAIRLWVGLDRGAAGKTDVTLVWEAVERPGIKDVADRVDVIAGSGGEAFFRGRVNRDPAASSPAAGRVTFAAPPGPLQLRLSAVAADGTVVDAAEQDVVVPDLTGVGPVIGTPQLFHARTVRDVQTISAGPVPLPAAGHDFSRTERLVVRFRAWGPADTAPALVLRLLNRTGQAMSTLAAPARAADGFYQTDFPLSGLAAGQYMLEIEASSETGKTRTLVAFTITS